MHAFCASSSQTDESRKLRTSLPKLSACLICVGHQAAVQLADRKRELHFASGGFEVDAPASERRRAPMPRDFVEPARMLSGECRALNQEAVGVQESFASAAGLMEDFDAALQA